MKSHFTYTLALVLILTATVAGLARRSPREQRPIRREIRAYFAANVLPVLRQQRQQLEPLLAAADRAQLATYRTQLKALKEQGQALRRRVVPESSAAPATRPVLTDAQLKQAHDLRFQARGIMLNVAQMAQRYDGAITQLTQEVAPQKEQWATDIKAIVTKNMTSVQQQQLAVIEGRKHERGGLRRYFRPAMFLLLDPNAPADALGERGVGSNSFYPNPAAATTQLEYEVKKAGPVSVDLLDKDGNKLRTLLAETQQEKGSQRQQLDLSDLPAGTYFYKITTKSGTQTKRFVKE